MNLQPHQERVVCERSDLADKLDKLGKFLFAGTSIVLSLPVEEQSRLLKQYAYMRIYLEVLDERIAAFTSAADSSATTKEQS